MAQLSELEKQYQTLKMKGVKILLISSQPMHQTAKLAERFSVPFAFLVDENNALARAWGLLVEGNLPFGLEMYGYQKDVAQPAVIVCDKKNQIIFLDVAGDFRVRPESIELLNMLL